jgi:hypothetical protein
MKEKIFLIFALFAAVTLAGRGISPAEEAPIGIVKKVEETAFIVRNGSSQAARPGHPVFLNDVLKTGVSGALGVTFNDDTRISIGPDTEYVVDEYVYQPKEMALSFVSRITRGTLQYISGTIAKIAPESVSVKTPTGTIGIRGTRFLLKVEAN